MCFLMCLINISCGFNVVPFGPIAKTILDSYDQSASTINLTASLYATGIFLMGIPSTQIISKLGLRKSLIIAELVISSGAVSRVFFNEWFYAVLIG
jgi:fucose permease